ncbi:uncharacterized protein [Penaeus vannamei]|uniref:uncharacterized protein isoform X2 n=1 Tax=Penaeus vannamei TaxID=6689 RepID=UPI00387F7253
MEVRRRVMRLSGSLCLLLALMSLRRVCCAPSGGHRASPPPPQALMTHLKTNLSARLQLLAQGEVKRQPARTEGAGRSGSWLHDLLALLHLLGVSEADLAAVSSSRGTGCKSKPRSSFSSWTLWCRTWRASWLSFRLGNLWRWRWPRGTSWGCSRAVSSTSNASRSTSTSSTP